MSALDPNAEEIAAWKVPRDVMPFVGLIGTMKEEDSEVATLYTPVRVLGFTPREDYEKIINDEAPSRRQRGQGRH